MRSLIRLFPASVALAAVAASAAPITALSVAGRLTAGDNAGSQVSATCRVVGGGLIGSGSLSGRNPQTGAGYSYPFNITGGRTASGRLILTGRFVNGPALTLTTQVPAGALSFVYALPGGRASRSYGQGTVTTR